MPRERRTDNPPKQPEMRRSPSELGQQGEPLPRAARPAQVGAHQTQPLPMHGQRFSGVAMVDPPAATPSTTPATPQPSWLRRSTRRTLRVITHWKTLLFLAFIGCGGASALAVAYIFQLPGLPNCPAVFWPLASASMRFECARIAASKESANDLLEAIALVDGVPQDNPMREEANRLVELWSQEVLKLADELFHDGKLNEAIAAAQKIPAKVTAAKLVESRIKTWKTTWQQAETILQKTEAALRKRDWKLAFAQAIKLLDLDCRYWQTTRYDDLNTRINTARADGNKLYEAERLAAAGGLDNTLKAMKMAQEIGKDSYVYGLAQKAIRTFGQQLLDLAQDALNRRNLQAALSIVDKIPDAAKLSEPIKDFTIMANAQAQVWQDTVAGLEAAIAQAQRIRPDRPFYKKAQQLITRWQYEIEGLAQLERARAIAIDGSPGNLAAAIATAALISPSNPRWADAQRQVQAWRAEIQTLEDRPVLDQADQLAAMGSPEALQAAIAQANQVTAGRALASEAQSKSRQWRKQLQTMQDQPYLDQANAYAQAGNPRAAIATAEQIQSGRALYDEAQGNITTWRNQIQAEVDRAAAERAQAQAQQTLDSARQLAGTGTSVALANAIAMASQASPSGSLRTDVDAAINEWSWQLLQLARDQAGLNPTAAIGIAEKIPPRANAYAEAQAQIATWKQPVR
jgi:hypothetical protein